MAAIAIVGAGTGVGKTHAAARLLRALAENNAHAAPYKPVESGIDDNQGVPADAAALRDASGIPLRLEHVCPWPLPRSVAPAEEIERLGVALSLDRLVAAAEALREAAGTRRLVFEGAGGVLSPLTWDLDALDLAGALDAALWIVVRDELGAISAARTAYEAARARKLTVLGVLLNRFPDEASVEPNANLRALRRLGIKDTWAVDDATMRAEILPRTRAHLERGDADVGRR